MASSMEFSDAELRSKLAEYGFNGVPVTPTTRKVLVKKLKECMERKQENSNGSSPRKPMPSEVHEEEEEEEDDFKGSPNVAEEYRYPRARKSINSSFEDRGDYSNIQQLRYRSLNYSGSSIYKTGRSDQPTFADTKPTGLKFGHSQVTTDNTSRLGIKWVILLGAVALIFVVIGFSIVIKKFGDNSLSKAIVGRP